MRISLRPCPGCGRGEIALLETTLQHSSPHHKRCPIYALDGVAEVNDAIEELVRAPGGPAIVVTTTAWVRCEPPPAATKLDGLASKALR